jgi:hypothetical protein
VGRGGGVTAATEPSAAAFQKWLRQHPEVRIISRDRDSVYAEGGYGGAPQAEQVADRFHLVQNLIKAVPTELEHQRHHLLVPATEFLQKDTIAALPSRQRWGRPTLRQSSEATNVRTSGIRAASLTDSALGGLSNRCTKPEEEPKKQQLAAVSRAGNTPPEGGTDSR